MSTSKRKVITWDVLQAENVLYLQTGCLFKSIWEISGRYSDISLDINIAGINPVEQYVLDISKYIVERKLKVQTNLSNLNLDAGTNKMIYRFQVEVHFYMTSVI